MVADGNATFATKRIKDGYPDLLNYSLLIDEGLLLLKDGSLLAGWVFAGPDMDSTSPRELDMLAMRLNQAICQLGDNWVLNINVTRLRSCDYPLKGYFPDPTSLIIDHTRKSTYQKGISHHENVSSLVVTYKPPKQSSRLGSAVLYQGSSAMPVRVDHAEHLFKEKLEQLYSILSSALTLQPMDSRELLSFLHCAATGYDNPLSVPDDCRHIDCLIGSQDFVTGLYPRVGQNWIVSIALYEFPASTYQEMLSAISNMPFALRLSTRFIVCDCHTAERQMRSKLRFWEDKKWSWSQRRRGADMSKFDRHADTMMLDIEDAIADANAGQKRYGYYTGNIVLMDKDRDTLHENAQLVIKEINRTGFTAKLETINSVESFLGTLPGHAYYNVRKPLINSVNVSHLAVLTSVWPGLPTHPSALYQENSPPLIYCTSNGSTPFRFNTHVSDVGSTLVVGPTGSGKTVLLNMIASQFRRYQNAQVFYFDKDYGAEILALAHGGNHYDLLGPEGEGVTFYPLAHVDDPSERIWASDWVEVLVNLQNLILSPEQRRLVNEALVRLADSPSRTITELLVQDEQVQAALSYYDISGSSGGILDASCDSLNDGSFEVFELTHLMSKGDKLVIPTLLYLMHRVEGRLTGAPTLIIIDEAWVLLMNSLASSKVEEWLRVIRKKNGALVLATQSLVDINDARIREILLESCPTKVFLPNPHALDPRTRTQYEAVGLTDRQIAMLSNAIPKCDYFYSSTLGKRMFQLNLSQLELAFIGVNGTRNRLLARGLSREHGPRWPHYWLKHLGLEKDANRWANYYEHMQKCDLGYEYSNGLSYDKPESNSR